MHWYQFQLDKDLIVCHANRKKDIEGSLNANLRFLGCVDKTKIGALRNSQYHTVFNSVSKMVTALKDVAPHLVKES